jgi:hypothetical protein
MPKKLSEVRRAQITQEEAMKLVIDLAAAEDWTMEGLSRAFLAMHQVVESYREQLLQMHLVALEGRRRYGPPRVQGSPTSLDPPGAARPSRSKTGSRTKSG